MTAASRVNQARRAAGFSQRELSRRTGVPQSAIARIERGQQIPRADTLDRLLEACGFELRLAPARGGGVDQSQIREWLDMSPAERLRRATGYGRMIDRLRHAEAGRARRSVNPVFDPMLAMRVLNRHEVEYVLIGGLAGEILGRPSGTNDIDICYRRTPRTWIDWRMRCGSSMPSSGSPGLTRTCPSSSTDARSPPATPSRSSPTPATSTSSAPRRALAGFRDLDAGATSYDLGDGLVVRIVASTTSSG